MWEPRGADGAAQLDYQLQPDTNVVRIVSRPADGRGYHSMVHTTGTSFALPPLATLTLEAVEPPGSWEVAGKRVKQTLYTLGVTFL